MPSGVYQHKPLTEEHRKKISLHHQIKHNSTEFKKGFIPWNKGLKGAQKWSPESRKKLSEYAKKHGTWNRLKGRIPWNKGTKGRMKAWNKGLTKETDQRMKKVSIGVSVSNKRRILSGEKIGFKLGHPFLAHKSNCRCFKCFGITEQNHATFHKGVSQEAKLKIGRASAINMKGVRNSPKTEFTPERMRGKNNPRWKGGVTPIHSKIRNSPEGRAWIKSVFNRDYYTDQKTGVKGGYLIAHHILNFAEYPELRFDINNGIALSRESHNEFHKKYGKTHNTREQLEEFLGRKI